MFVCFKKSFYYYYYHYHSILFLFLFFRAMMSQLTSAGNHSHFARLFLKQLVQVVYVLILLSLITVTDKFKHLGKNCLFPRCVKAPV